MIFFICEHFQYSLCCTSVVLANGGTTDRVAVGSLPPVLVSLCRILRVSIYSKYITIVFVLILTFHCTLIQMAGLFVGGVYGALQSAWEQSPRAESYRYQLQLRNIGSQAVRTMGMMSGA